MAEAPRILSAGWLSWSRSSEYRGSSSLVSAISQPRTHTSPLRQRRKRANTGGWRAKRLESTRRFINDEKGGGVTTRPAVSERYLTAREVAARLGLRPETVLRYYNAGLIPGRRLPGKIRPVRFVWNEVEAAFGGEERSA